MTEQTIRSLAHAGAPSIAAPPFLAERIVALHHRSVRRRRLGASLALVGLVAGGTVAARWGGEGRFYEIYQPSESMTPTVGVREHLVADRELTPQRDDVVQLRLKNGVFTGLAINRVIGLPGDIIACPAGNDGYCHAWTRNGQPLDEPWVGRDRRDPADGFSAPGFFLGGSDRIVPFPAVTVTPGHAFVLGDNRDNSVDSRLSHPVLQELSAVEGVGVEVIGTDGRRRPIPGAPQHEVPGPGRNVDPAEGPPPANSSP